MNAVSTALEHAAAVVFPDASWSSTAFAPLLRQVAAKHPIRWVTNEPKLALADAPSTVTALPLGELSRNDRSASALRCWRE